MKKRVARIPPQLLSALMLLPMGLPIFAQSGKGALCAAPSPIPMEPSPARS
jgi:hypothetical protein